MYKTRYKYGKKNTGKLFEDDFKASVPKDTYYVRLHDAAIGFDTKSSKQRFAPKSPYDAILCRAGQMYAIELKSHKEKRFSFGEKNADIKKRQVKKSHRCRSSRCCSRCSS